MATEHEQYVAAAEKFIKAIWDTDVVVNQKNIDTITAEMARLGVSRINESSFHAGLFSARSQGLLELKAPASPPATPASAPEPAPAVAEPRLGTRSERLRLAGINADTGHQTVEDKKQAARLSEEKADTRRRTDQAIRKFVQSKTNAEPVTVYRSDGRVDHAATQALRNKHAQ